jgi:hypothetical protein
MFFDERSEVKRDLQFPLRIERYFGPCSLFSSLAELRYGQCLHPELQQVPRFKWYCAVKTTYGPS